MDVELFLYICGLMIVGSCCASVLSTTIIKTWQQREGKS